MTEQGDPPGFAVERRSFLRSAGLSAGAAALAASTAPAAATDHDRDGRDDDTDGADQDTSPMTYELPNLPYDYDAFEPHIDERIVELHHSAHHQAYVDGANEALDELDRMRDADDFDGVRAVRRDLSFNLSGHVNHTVFWQNMAPDGGGEPDGELADAIEESFGSFETFRDEFSQTARAVQGAGWAMLFYEPVADGPVVGQVESQHLLAHQDATPLLTLDVWEHAYYLQYENDRGAYVDAWWNVVDWEDVESRYQDVREGAAERY